MQIKNIALFIDFENFVDNKSFDALKLVSKLKERGRLILKRAYADWGRFSGSKRQMLENSIELIEMPSHSQKGKNSADIKLVVDALETAMTKNYIDTFVVVAGDSDYTPLISKLRELDKYVMVIGDRQSMSNLLSGYCDEIYYYDNFIGIVKNVSTSKLTTAYQLLERAITNLESHGSKALGSRVKQYMLQLDSSFNESDLGFRSLKEFWQRASKDKIITIDATGNGDTWIQMYNGEKDTLDISDKKELWSLVYWSVQACLDVCSVADISDISQKISCFDSSFSIEKYGYTKSQGFKKIIFDCQDKNMLRCRWSEEDNKYFITLDENAHELLDTADKPYNYNEILEMIRLGKQTAPFKKALRDKGFHFNLEKINEVAGQINIILEKEQDTLWSLDNLKNQLINIEEKKQENTLQQGLNTLFQSGSFLDENNNIVSNETTKTIKSLVSSSVIEENAISFINKKLSYYLGKEEVEPKVLNFIVYGK